jgi:hypothetical protein
LSVGQTLKSYVWWTHERGSVHYDVMVTLILAFIFLTPRFIHYGDAPKPDWPANEIRLGLDSTGALVGEVPSALLQGQKDKPAEADFENAIAPVAGKVTVERWQPFSEVGGRVVAWRVWARR